jgi:hypothetical protein
LNELARPRILSGPLAVLAEDSVPRFGSGLEVWRVSDMVCSGSHSPPASQPHL